MGLIYVFIISKFVLSLPCCLYLSVFYFPRVKTVILLDLKEKEWSLRAAEFTDFELSVNLIFD